MWKLSYTWSDIDKYFYRELHFLVIFIISTTPHNSSWVSSEITEINYRLFVCGNQGYNILTWLVHGYTVIIGRANIKLLWVHEEFIWHVYKWAQVKFFFHFHKQAFYNNHLSPSSVINLQSTSLYYRTLIQEMTFLRIF